MENTTTETTATTWVHPFESAGLGKAPFRFTSYWRERNGCMFCGTGIMNCFGVKSADGKHFHVGCDCIYKIYRTAPRRDSLFAEVRKADREMRAKRRAELALEKRETMRQARRLVAQTLAAKVLEEDPELARALQCVHPIVQDIGAKLTHYGSLSPAQVNLVFKLYRESIGPHLPPETHIPAPTGRVTVVGDVVSTRRVEGMYGTQYKMVVKVSNERREVWLVWTTIPSNLYGYNVGEYGVRDFEDLKGCTVKFDAKLTHGNEPHFAFGNRPTKASILKNPNNNT